MGLIGEITNKVCNASAGALGMNTRKGALQILVKANKIHLYKPGTVLDPSREFGDDYLQELQVDGKLLIIDGIETWEENGSDDTSETKSNDVQTILTEGLYKFMATFNKGLYGNKQMESIKGFGRFDIALQDRLGNFLYTADSSGGVRGFSTGMIQNVKYKMQDDSAGEASGIMFQWLDRSEFDRDYVFIPECEYTGNARLIEGISQVDLGFVNTPTNGDTTITFDAFLDQDKVTAVEGLESDDIRYRVDGVATSITPVAVAGIPGRYTATVPSIVTGETLDLMLYKTTTSKSVIIKDTALYKSIISSKLAA